MDHSEKSSEFTPQGNSPFPMTRWTWVREVQNTESQDTEIAVNDLCGAYWYPLYLTARRKRGLGHHDAEDQTQAFWIWILEKGHLANARPELGKFRNFLVGYFENFLRNESRSASALKRGGGVQIFSCDQTQIWHDKFEKEIGQYPSPDEHLDVAWRLASLEAAFKEVETNWRSRGKGNVFDALKEFLKSGAERGQYREIAASLGLSEANIRQYASTLRKDLRAARTRWMGE